MALQPKDIPMKRLVQLVRGLLRGLLQELLQPQRWQQQQHRKRLTMLSRWHLLLCSTQDTQHLQMIRDKNKIPQFSNSRTLRHSRAQ